MLCVVSSINEAVEIDGVRPGLHLWNARTGRGFLLGRIEARDRSHSAQPVEPIRLGITISRRTFDCLVQ
jgi:hypothetical protein